MSILEDGCPNYSIGHNTTDRLNTIPSSEPKNERALRTLSSKRYNRKCSVNTRDIIKRYFKKRHRRLSSVFYENTVYILFWIMMLYDCYYHYCHFCPNIIAFYNVKLYFSKSYKESGITIIMINWNIAISCNYQWMKCCQKK